MAMAEALFWLLLWLVILYGVWFAIFGLF